MLRANWSDLIYLIYSIETLNIPDCLVGLFCFEIGNQPYSTVESIDV